MIPVALVVYQSHSRELQISLGARLARGEQDYYRQDCYLRQLSPSLYGMTSFERQIPTTKPPLDTFLSPFAPWKQITKIGMLCSGVGTKWQRHLV